MTTADHTFDTFGSDAALRESLISQSVQFILNYTTWNNDIEPTMNSYSTSTLTRIVDMYATRNPKAGSRFAAALYVVSGMINNGKREGLVADMLDLIPAVADCSVQAIWNTTNALAHYRRLGWVPERTNVYSDPRYGQLMFVINRIDSIMVNRGGNDVLKRELLPFDFIQRDTAEEAFLVITNEQLIKLIWSHAGEHKRIIALVEERKSMDPDLLASVLDCESPALSEGAL